MYLIWLVPKLWKEGLVLEVQRVQEPNHPWHLMACSIASPGQHRS